MSTLHWVIQEGSSVAYCSEAMKQSAIRLCNEVNRTAYVCTVEITMTKTKGDTLLNIFVCLALICTNECGWST